MIDFRLYANTGLHTITYNGLNSLNDLDVLIAAGTNTDNLAAVSVQESIPYRQGVIDSSRRNGETFYEARELTYQFKAIADTDNALQGKIAEVMNWLNSSGDFRIYDNRYDGDYFDECALKSVTREDGEKISVAYCYITAVFSAYPFLVKSGSRTRIAKAAGTGNKTFTVTNNSSISIDGGAAKAYSVEEPYTYRMTVYAEGAHTITLNGTEIQPEEPFTMPASAMIEISGEGYGYYELWHDTREVRL
jgi:hypothetical protein